MDGCESAFMQQVRQQVSPRRLWRKLEPFKLTHAGEGACEGEECVWRAAGMLRYVPARCIHQMVM
jgi:hypothetical protein